MTSVLSVTAESAAGWRHRVTRALTVALYADTRAIGDDHGSHACSQMLVLADHLARHDGRLAEDLLAEELAHDAELFADHHQASGTSKVLAHVAAGGAWWEAARSLHGGAGSYGSDAAVRATAAGLVDGIGVSAAAQLGRRSALVTHTHVDARDGAACHAAAVWLAARLDPGEPVDAEHFLDVLNGQTRGPRMRALLFSARSLVRQKASARETANAMGSLGHAAPSLAAAVIAFLLHPDDPHAAIRYAVQFGAEGQAAATLAGALSGARSPSFRAPLTWSIPHQFDSRLRRLALPGDGS